MENLLSLSRIEEGGVRIKTEVELLDDIIDEALRHIDRHGAEHSVTAEPSGELLLVRADARLIVQVIINLVNNAVKYTPPGSAIRIKTEKKDGKAFVSVSDDGPGIPAEEQERVFDMFYSGAKRSPDSRRGVGMGLALCRSIVLAHEGTIILRDNEPHGAVFTFSLPLSEVPIIVISARGEDADKITALDAGADDYLTKPFSVDELLARLRVVQRRLARSAAENAPAFANGPLEIDYEAGVVRVAGAEVSLTPGEYKLLCLFAKNVGKVLTHTYITDKIWGNSLETDVATLRVFMASLRKKIETDPAQPKIFQTHIGIGYRMNRL